MSWTVILRPDGVVDWVEGGAPVTWLGHRLADAAVPEEVRAAAEALEKGPSGPSFLRRCNVSARGNGQEVTIELLLVEGLPVRKSYTRIDGLMMRTLDVFIAQARSSDVDLKVEQTTDVPEVMLLDSEKIAWVLATLVGNALRFAGARPNGGGHVRVAVSWEEDHQELVVTVKDNGPGMPQSQAHWLFERNPETGQSVGLALLMVRDVVVAHRGRIAVDSTPGGGMTFILRIPRVSR